MTLRHALLLLVVTVLGVHAGTAHSQTRCELPVSAYLTDADGVPLDGTIDVELRFYDAPGDATPPAECRSFAAATVDTGWLRLSVDGCAEPPDGDCGVVPLDALFGGVDGLWIGVQVDGIEIPPRIAVGSVPFAMRAGDSLTLQGAGPDAFEAAGTIDAHAADPDAHHSSTSDGLALTPSSVQVGDTLLEDGRVDLGAEADDELTSEIVATLTGGGDADALHGHGGSHGAGGSCYVAWGTATCGGDFTAMYTGVGLLMSQYSDWGGTGIGLSSSDLVCVADTGIDSFTTSRSIAVAQLLVARDGGERALPVEDRLVCAMCCM